MSGHLRRSPGAAEREALADKLERQPLHERCVILSWATVADVVDALRRAR